MSHIIALTVGDWSDDGHGKTATHIYETNLPRSELNKAFDAGTEKVGFNLENVCEDYEDNTLLRADYDLLVDAGITWTDQEYRPEQWDREDPNSDFTLWHDSFALLWMKIAQLGNPELVFKEVKDNTANIEIGGYGLFH